MNDWFDVVQVVQASPEKLLKIDVLRQNQLLHLQVMPQAKRDSMGNVSGMLGVQSTPGKITIPEEYKQTIQYSPTEALVMAVDKTGQISGMILNSMVKMVRGLIGLDNLSGPITIAKVAGQSAEMGWQTFISFMALMSVSLGILNLLPIPMLDGGHLVYYVIELIRGKPVSEQIQLFGLKIGMVLLGSMMLLALFNDFMRL
jgi:regulator of sigma E protease